MYDVNVFITESEGFELLKNTPNVFKRLESLPLETLPAPKRTNAFDTPNPDIKTGAPVMPTYTPTDNARQLAPIDSVQALAWDKGYKIYVKPKGQDRRYTLVGYVLQSGTSRIAIDVYGKRHDIVESQRLREKHVRSAFGIDERFDFKQTCVQFDAQRNSDKPKRSPKLPNAPVCRRPKIG